MASYEHPQRITAMVFLSDDMVLAATEDLQLCRISTDGVEELSTGPSISARVKDFHIVKGGVLAAFSDGRVTFLKDGNLESAGSVSIGDGVRIISLAAYDPGQDNPAASKPTASASKVGKKVIAGAGGSERPQHRSTDVTAKSKKQKKRQRDQGVTSQVVSGDRKAGQGQPRREPQKEHLEQPQQKQKRSSTKHT